MGGHTVQGTKAEMLAAFGSFLWANGVLIMPNLLLSYYTRLGLDEAEVMLLIQVFRMQAQEGDQFPTPEKLAQFMSIDAGKVREIMVSLMEKKMLNVAPDLAQPNGRCRYDWKGFMLRLAEVWLAEYDNDPQSASNSTWAEVYDAYEKELGRPLSPLECTQLEEWCRKYPSVLVHEALRLAVMHGVYHFRYIETILLEWQRSNVRTVREAQEHETRFRERKSKKTRGFKSGESRPAADDKNKEAKYRDLYLS